MSELVFDTSIVYDYLALSDKKISVFQGGARSGKTYNIMLWFVVKLLNETGRTLTVCRQTLPALKRSAMSDFFNILKKYDLYDASVHNKSDCTYELNGNLIEFASIDQAQKLRGVPRHYLFINEANELKYEDWMQLLLRTAVPVDQEGKTKIILDYNPSMEDHWIYDHVIPREDADFYITTFRDNPYLPLDQIKEIERLEKVDEQYWKIYGLGQRGGSRELIYTHWQQCDELPRQSPIFYGLDFGFHNPTVLVEVEIFNGSIYCNELVYESKMITQDLLKMFEVYSINRRASMFADSAEPKTIEEIQRAGYNITSSDKSVIDGIMKIKSMPLYITKRSEHLLKEIRNYKWKKDLKTEKILDEPVKLMDHALDALRYAVLSYTGKVPRRNLILAI
jgi:phage terminase large subunit